MAFLLATTTSQAITKFRLYDFEEGTAGVTTTTAADAIDDLVFFGSGFGLVEVPGSTARPLPAGNLQDVVASTALTDPALNAFSGSATFYDMTSDRPAVSIGDFSWESPSTLGLEFDGTSTFDDFGTGDGTKSVFFLEDSYNANEAVASGVNTAESFNILTQAWVRPSASGSGTEQIVYDANNAFGQVKITADGFWQLDGVDLTTPIEPLDTTIPVAFDEWTHVAVFRTGTSATFYVNGSVAASGGSFFNTWPTVLSVGGGEFGASAFEGVIDEFSTGGTPLSGFDPVADLDYFDVFEGIDLPAVGDPDINLDGTVDQADYVILAGNVGFDNGSGVGDFFTWLDGDLDQNGVIDFFDFNIMAAAAAANGVTLSFANVPEPTSVSLIGLAGAALLACRRRTRATAAVAVAVVAAPQAANADVVIAEDFFYEGTTKAIDDLNGFAGTSYGGGQSGLGAWEDRWTAVGGATIVSSDGPTAQLANNPYTGVVSEFATDVGLDRDYTFGSAASASTIYFAADMKVVDTAQSSIFAEFGFLSPTDDADAPVVSLGITDSESSATPTFFGQLGGTVVTGDGNGVAADALVDDTFQRIVGKLELNAGAPSAGDFNSDGVVDAADYTVLRNAGSPQEDFDTWSANYGATAAEVLTVYFNPTGEETSDATVLTVEASIINSLDDGSLDTIVTLNGTSNTALDSQRPQYIDDIVIGTTWDSVAAVDVPRLTATVDQVTGDITISNDSSSDIDLAYYEIISESGSLLTTFDSLADQGLDGGEWAENNPTATQLTESNFTDSTTLAASGGSVVLAGAFDTSGDSDLLARFGVKSGASGLLNLMDVQYVSAASVAVPEPTGLVAALIVYGVGSSTASSRRRRD